jgi:hypothetical protein
MSEESEEPRVDRLGALTPGLRLLTFPLAAGRVALAAGLGVIFEQPSSERPPIPASVSIYSDEIESSLEGRTARSGEL